MYFCLCIIVYTSSHDSVPNNLNNSHRLHSVSEDLQNLVPLAAEKFTRHLTTNILQLGEARAPEERHTFLADDRSVGCGKGWERGAIELL